MLVGVAFLILTLSSFLRYPLPSLPSLPSLFLPLPPLPSFDSNQFLYIPQRRHHQRIPQNPSLNAHTFSYVGSLLR